MHDPLTDGEPPGGEQTDIDKAAQIGKQHRVKVAPAYYAKSVCRNDGEYDNTAVEQFFFAPVRQSHRPFPLKICPLKAHYSINHALSQPISVGI